MRGADVVAQTLVDLGVETIFSLSGNQIMSIYDALFDTDIRIVHTRHEAAAGFMAEGYARIKGRPGVALVTAGSGLGNAISPLITTRASQTPLVLISGDSPVSLDGKGAFQEMPQVALTSPLTKWSIRVTDPAEIAATMARAYAMAQDGQPGPVHISLPDDVLKDVAPDQARFTPDTAPGPDYAPLRQALAQSKKPLILHGPGMPLSDTSGLPVLRLESPRGAKDPSLGRFKSLWQDADLVVALGKPVDFSVGFGTKENWPNASWFAVHGDPSEVARAKAALGARLIATLESAPSRAQDALEGVWTDECEWLDQIRSATEVKPDIGTGLTSATLSATLAEHLASCENPIFVADGGEIGQWGQAFVRTPRRIINGVSGTIGAGICYAIGAKIAAPDAEVYLLMGDGTAGFHLAEFETAAREGVAITAIIGNDRRWNAEHHLQIQSFGPDRTHSCTLSNANYATAAEALGATGLRVETLKDLGRALAKVKASEGAVCLDVQIEGLPAPDV